MTSYWDPIDPALRPALAQLGTRRADALAAGAVHVGWKVGMNDHGVRTMLGIGSGVVGFLTDRTQSTGDVVVAGCSAVAAEIEVALVLGDDLRVAALRPAIEIVDVVGDTVDAALERGVWHHAFVLGAKTPWHDGIIDELRVTATHDGAPFDVPPPAEDKLADLDALLVFVGEGVDAMGGSLAPGDVILAGSLAPSVRWVTAGAEIRATIEPLGDVVARLVG